jgi:hypothetical protein
MPLKTHHMWQETHTCYMQYHKWQEIKGGVIYIFLFFVNDIFFSRDVLYIKCCQGCMASPLSTTCSFLLDPEHNRSKETFMQDALCNSRAPVPGDGPRYILVVCHEFMSYIHSYTKFGDLHLCNTHIFTRIKFCPHRSAYKMHINLQYI